MLNLKVSKQTSEAGKNKGTTKRDIKHINKLSKSK